MAIEKEQLQPIVNAFAVHLRKQGMPALDDAGECMYRAGHLSCGIGGLISDEHYSRAFEGERAFQPEIRNALSLSGFPNNAISNTALRELQNVHDRAGEYSFADDLEQLLARFCNEYGVDYPASA